MFDEINLRVIDAIFTSCEPPIKAFARSLYLNCLINEFKKRKAVDYSKGFEISISDIKEFSKYEKHFAELEQSGLCEIDGKKIIFWNVWDEHLAPKGYKQPVGGDYLSKPIKEFENAIQENIDFHELICLKHGIDIKNVPALLNEFIKESSLLDMRYFNESQAKKHCLYWCAGFKYSKQKDSNKVNEKAPVKIVSKSKILGI